MNTLYGTNKEIEINLSDINMFNMFIETGNFVYDAVSGDEFYNLHTIKCSISSTTDSTS